MSTPNLINIIVHIIAGTIAMAIGFVILARTKGDKRHRALGKVFVYFTFVVCGTAAIGIIVFRFLPLFAVLTVLVSYQLVSGWRAVKTKENGPELFDGLWTIIGLVGMLAFVPILVSGENLGSPSVIYSSIGALGIVLTYDSLRWLFPKHWNKTLWQYEHVYKLNAALFGMLSALVGNVIRFGQPWSQTAPSVLGMLVILVFFVKIYRNASVKE